MLLQLADPSEDFRVIFSGKTSKKVDGLYKPEEREIIIHNRNAETDDQLIYTAIHEFAHHLQFSESPIPLSTRTHNSRFWSIFHSLLMKAEELRLYASPFDRHREFIDLTRRIKESIFTENGKLMKELGGLLLEAKNLCEKYHASYEDYLDRILCLPRSSAKVMVKSHVYDLDPYVGFENMRSLVRIPEAEKRNEAQVAIIGGKSPDMIRMEYLAPWKSKDPIAALEQERDRLEKTIRSLNRRLADINRKIESYGH